MHAGGLGRRFNEGPCIRLLYKIGLGQFYSCMLSGPAGVTIIGTDIPICRKSMDSVDSLDFYHGLSGHLPWTQWTFTMDSVDSLDFYHGLSGHLPWTQWTLTMDSVDIYHGLSRLPGLLPWTQWTFTMDSVDINHGLSG